MIDELFDAAEDLASLLEQENSALGLHDFAATARFAGLKRQAIERFGAVSSNHVKAASPAPVARSRTALRARLEAALTENKRLLEDAIKVQAEVIAIVLRSIEAPASPQYRINGTQPCGSAAPVALAMRA